MRLTTDRAFSARDAGEEVDPLPAGQGEHDVAATAWLHRAARGSRVDIIEAFEHAFTALWRRVHLTLGEVTVAAILDRVLQVAAEEYPALAATVVTESGIQCESLRTAADLREDRLRAALRFVLVEFLTVLGNLTAEILTPTLHDELSRCNSHTRDSSGSLQDEFEDTR